MRPRVLALGVFLVTCLLAREARAEDRALLIGVGNHDSGEWSLPLIAENIRLMEAALADQVGVAPGKLRKILDREATRNKVRIALQEAAQVARPQDRLFLYFTGHGTKVTVEGAPIRAHFTWETAEVFGGEGFDPETLITDIDIRAWLQPLKAKGVLATLIREACYCGGGYDQVITPLSPGKPPSLETVADLEFSACGQDQAAWPLEGARPRPDLQAGCSDASSAAAWRPGKG